MHILEDCPILLGIFNAVFVAEGFGIALEVDDISAILLLFKHLGYRGLAPLIRIWLSFLTASAHTLN